ncbi:MAG: hypothetical protein IKK85_07685 [Clostridia bacterium]|nr:hypothetical protein [Clostridia bacterium]
MLKKSLCLLLAGILLMCCYSPAMAADTSTRLYTAYGDGMLFKQNEPVTLAGIAENGCVISASLLNAENNELASAQATAQNNSFSLTFDGMPGGYDTYTIILKADGKEFEKLENIVFGELWLASGQSNMMYPLGQAKDGAKMAAEGKKGSKWLRIYIEPPYPTYNGKENAIPVEAQPEIVGGHWITGESNEVYGMSAVAYYFAEKLIKELDMPVGILNSSLGGSTIYSWLSREAIDNDKDLKEYYVNADEYIEKSDWKEDQIDIYNTMCANYNLRTYSYRNFRLSGMIWYQGETELMYNRSTDRYARELDLMQRSYAELFNYDGERLPLIMTQLAAYCYSDNEFVLPERNYAFTQMQQSKPDSMAVTSLYDLPVTYLPEVGVIHPEHKTEVGQRMAFAAMGLVYGKKIAYTVATPEKTEIKDGSIYITFKNTGDGLRASSEIIRGFTVCGDDGIHIPAKAQIVSADTVRVYNENVSEPKSASYAYCVTNERANLYASENGEITLPVSPFDTNPDISTRYWREATWMDCDDEKAWRNSYENSAYYTTWADENAVLEKSKDFYSGTASLNIKTNEKTFAVHPITFIDKTDIFCDAEKDFSDYNTLSFYIKNNGSETVTFDGLKMYSCKTGFEYYSPAVIGTKDICAEIPADGQWHKVTLDLDQVYYYGNECTAAYSNSKLKYTGKINFCFTSNSDNTDINMDCFEFTASNEKVNTRFDCDITNADNVWEYICAFFTTVIGAVISLFTK